ncbi:hypothetical protein [Rubinisphaera margarita]|uniref:hypothetical protein n=1 Tax=Rubinisphaera margarita TaxID=2909586 RepID=UPI001EE80182|nr:hypothetical protein [Rubinisphaera margarita]MCG6157330.1 hypothetical protein [Rubinisphaera margarita]
MIKLGIIGASGSDFAKLYVPALEALQKRVRVECIYDYVAHCAEQSARLINSTVAHSFRSLIRRSDIDAVLVLGSGWPGILPVVECLREEKPVYVANSLAIPEDIMPEIGRMVVESGAITAVENRFCYAPAGLRSQELIASELGRPVTVTRFLSREAALESQLATIAEAMGWFRHLLPGYEFQIDSAAEDPLDRFVLQRASRTGEVSTVNVQFSLQPDDRWFELATDQGAISIYSAEELGWLHHDAKGTEPAREILTHERNSVSRQIDFFCRRIVGGLIPVHDLSNGLWSQQQALAVLQRLSSSST